MESKNTIAYDVDKSSERMNAILDTSNSNFSDSSTIPARSSLTYTNGYYVNVTAIFVDIVGSSSMTDEHRRPTLAKTYRGFISECVAIMNSKDICKEINIHGDCVWGVFETPYKSNIDEVFYVAYTINSMIKILNYKLRKKGYSEISIGIGMDYGRALMVQAGYSGSAINDIIWMGDVVNSACNLCNKAGRNGREVIVVSNCIYGNLNEHNQGLLRSYFDIDIMDSNYEGNIVNTYMEEWYNTNCT